MIQHFSCNITGNAHERDGTPCQDKLLIFTNGISFFGLSDGAGSCKQSDIGASLTLKETYSWFLQNPNSSSPSDLLLSIQNCLDKYASENNLITRELSATLLFVFINNEIIRIGQVGDGIIGFRKQNTKFKKLFDAQKGEFANETTFVTSPLNKIKFQTVELSLEVNETIDIVLMTDGIEAVLFNSKEHTFTSAVDKFFQWLYDEPSEEVNLGIKSAIEKNIKPLTQDDLSIIGVSYRYEVADSSSESVYWYTKAFNYIKRLFNFR